MNWCMWVTNTMMINCGQKVSKINQKNFIKDSNQRKRSYWVNRYKFPVMETYASYVSKLKSESSMCDRWLGQQLTCASHLTGLIMAAQSWLHWQNIKLGHWLPLPAEISALAAWGAACDKAWHWDQWRKPTWWWMMRENYH